MRIISGTAKGYKLLTPKTHAIRPASDKVKGAVFNILGDVSDLTVLDLFAGTGNVGLEAVSRGAKSALFVDDLQESLTLIYSNIEKLHFESSCRVVKGRIPAVLNKVSKIHPRFDLIFVDPPYDKGLVARALEGLKAHNLVDAQSLIIIEHSPREMPVAASLEVIDSRKYGQTLISFMKRIA